MFRGNHIKIEMVAGRRAGSAVRLHEALKRKPILSLPRAEPETTLSYPATASAMKVLVADRIAREIRTRRCGRLLPYNEYLAILSKGIETPAVGPRVT